MNRRIAVRGVFVKDGRLLCVKLKPYNTSITGEFWCTIGGGVDTGEPILPALEREIIEETGIKPVVGELLYVQQFNTEGTEHIEFFFNILNTDDYLNIDLSKSTHGQKEIAEIDFIDVSNNVIFPKFLTEIDFTSFNASAPTKFYNYL